MNKTIIDLQSVDKSSKTTQKTDSKKETKTGSSLFDSLLNDAKNNSKEDKKSTKEKTKKLDKTDKSKKPNNTGKSEKSKLPSNNLNKLSIDAKIKEKSNSNNTDTKTGKKKNLFDSLVKDAKTSKTIKEELGDKSKKVVKNKTKIDDTKTDKKVQEKIDNQKSSLFDSLVKEVVNITVDKKPKKEKEVEVSTQKDTPIETKSSLFDAIAKEIVSDDTQYDLIDSQDIQEKKEKKKKNDLIQNKTTPNNSTKESKSKNNAFDSWNKPISNKSTKNIDQKDEPNKKLSSKVETQQAPQQKQQAPQKSLMDSMIDEAKSEDNRSKNIKNNKTETSTNNKTETTHNIIKNKILQSQAKQEKIEVHSIVSTGAKKVIYDQKDTIGVKKASNILELNLKNMKLEKSSNSKTELETPKELKHIINSGKNIQNNIQKNIQKDYDISTNIVQEGNQKEKPIKEIEIIVPTNLVNDLKNKITKARVQVGSMMSEIAKKMVENYRPPQTAFRITLNPHNMGSINIVIKKDLTQTMGKSAGLSIDMNMNNNSTHELIKAYQGDLKSALSKNFSNENLNLNITNSSNANSAGNTGNSSFGQAGSNNSNQNQQQKNQKNDSKNDSKNDENSDENTNDTAPRQIYF